MASEALVEGLVAPDAAPMNDTDDPFWLKWQELAKRRRSAGFASLSQSEQAFYALNNLKGAVFRGGFYAYFTLATGEEVDTAIRAFKENDAADIAAVIERAAAILFPGGIPEKPDDELPDWSDSEPEWEVELRKVNRAFYDAEEKVYEVVQLFFESRWRRTD